MSGTWKKRNLSNKIFHLKQKKTAGTFTESFNFEKHVNVNSVHLTRDELEAVNSLCKKYEKIFSKNSNDLGITNQIAHQIKLKPNAQPLPFRRAYENMSCEAAEEFTSFKNNSENCFDVLRVFACF